MKKKTFKLTAAAQETLHSINRYTEKNWGKKQRSYYNKNFYQRFKYLAENSSIGRNCDDLQTNLKSYPQGSHVIYYLTFNSYIEIVDILHQNEDAEQYFLDPSLNN